MKKILTPENYELIPLNDKTNVRFYTSVDQGSFVASHWHDALEIVYLQEGELKITVENEIYNLKAGQCILINSNLIHSTLCTKPNRAVVFQIPEYFLRKFVPDADQRQYRLDDPASSPQMQSKVNFFKDTLIKMQLLTDLVPDGAILRFNSLLFEILFQLYHNFSSTSERVEVSGKNKSLERLREVFDYTAENYNRPISINEISTVAAFEQKYFCRLFKKTMGVTFLEYQNEIRLSKIYHDIIFTDDQISVILERHGFTNYKLFRKMFHTHFGVTPSQLRKDRKNRESKK